MGTEITGIPTRDHGALTGLADDDHSQYSEDTELTAHEGNASAHHTKYTNAEAVAAVEADADLELTSPVVISGVATGDLQLTDEGGSANRKHVLIRNSNGAIAFSQLNDDFTSKLTVLTFSGLTGEGTFPVIPILPASDPTLDNQAARKGYVDADENRFQAVEVVASGTQIQAANAEATTSNSALTKVKEIVIEAPGTYRIAFDLKEVTSGGASGAIAEVRRNGVLVGAQQEDNDTTYTNYSQDIGGWSTGDLCQLYIAHEGGPADSAAAQNFRIHGDYAFKSVNAGAVNLD